MKSQQPTYSFVWLSHIFRNGTSLLIFIEVRYFGAETEDSYTTMTNSSSECPPLLVPQSQNCSGRGICISSTSCDCQDGWTGLGDFAFESPSCNIYIPAIQALWSILAFFQLLSLLFAIYYLRIKHKQSRLVARLPITMGYLFVVAASLLFCCAVLRATDFRRTIGSNVAVTLLFSLGTGTFWVSAHVFAYAFMEATNRRAMVFKASQQEQWLLSLQTVKISLIVTGILSFVFCLCPLGFLSSNSSSEFLIFGSLHYLGTGTSIFITGTFFIPRFTGNLQKDLENISIDVNIVPLQKVLFKVKLFNRILRQQVLTQWLLAFLFG